MVSRILGSPLFGIVGCVVAYSLGQWVNKRTKSSLLNPFLIAVCLLSAILYVSGMPYGEFLRGAKALTVFAGPSTVSLAVLLYRRRAILRSAVVPVVVGCFAGCVASVVGVYVVSWCMGWDEVLMFSLMPKSVTTPIAISLAEERGGVEALTMAALFVTGMTGVSLFPGIIRMLGVKSPIAEGLAIGTASHVVGTAKAAELGELQGAVSGIAIGMAGVIMTLLFMLI